MATVDRAYGTSFDNEFPLSESTTDRIESDDVAPRLAAGDWTGAPVAPVDGLRTGGSGTGGSVMHAEIIQLATQADDRLDAQAGAFDRMRALEGDAAGYVDGLASRHAELAARMPQAETLLDGVGRREAELVEAAGRILAARSRTVLVTRWRCSPSPP